jgi:hypothetical protein
MGMHNEYLFYILSFDFQLKQNISDVINVSTSQQS